MFISNPFLSNTIHWDHITGYEITFKNKNTDPRKGNTMKGNKVGPVRLVALILIITAVVIPVFAFFKFEWYYAGKESFAGNLSSGMDADENELWFANYDSASPDAQKINVFDAQTNEWKKSYSGGAGGIPISIFRFVSIEGSKVLTGGSTGAAVYDRSADEWKGYTAADGLPSKDVYSAVMNGDEIWIGTLEGIGVVDSAGAWKYYTMEDGLADNKVLHMLFDGPVLWICTENGISRFDTDSGEWKTYRQADGLPGDVARMALIDGNSIWFAMKGGIARIDRNSGEIVSYTPSSHGLLSDEFKDIEILDKKIYFASNKGVNYRDRSKEGKWKSITTKQGLPETFARQGQGSDVTHLAVQGDKLWIALWYEGLVRMSIPTGIAVIPVWFWVVALSAAGIVALIVIRPGAQKGEAEEKKKKVEERRKKAKTRKPSHETCGGVPKKELCNRCSFNTLKSGNLYCSKYNKTIEYK